MNVNYRKKLNHFLAERSLAIRQIKEEKAYVKEAKQELKAVQKAQHLVQQVAEVVQQQTHARIASVVTRCLQTVFDDPYEFRILFEKKRNKTEARLVFYREGIGEIDPTTAAGGGVVDVASFALRLVCLVLATPRKRRLLVLDECFKWVSKEYRPRLRALLEELAKEMQVQFIMVTHDSSLICGKVIELY